MERIGNKPFAPDVYKQLVYIEGDITSVYADIGHDNGSAAVLFPFKIASDELRISGANKIGFRDDGSYINSSSDETMDIFSENLRIFGNTTLSITADTSVFDGDIKIGTTDKIYINDNASAAYIDSLISGDIHYLRITNKGLLTALIETDASSNKIFRPASDAGLDLGTFALKFGDTFTDRIITEGCEFVKNGGTDDNALKLYRDATNTELIFAFDGTDRIRLKDDGISPENDDRIILGTSTIRYKSLYMMDSLLYRYKMEDFNEIDPTVASIPEDKPKVLLSLTSSATDTPVDTPSIEDGQILEIGVVELTSTNSITIEVNPSATVTLDAVGQHLTLISKARAWIVHSTTGSF